MWRERETQRERKGTMMYFRTQQEAQKYLDACNFAPALKARHKIVPTTYWPIQSDHPVKGWCIMLT